MTAVSALDPAFESLALKLFQDREQQRPDGLVVYITSAHSGEGKTYCARQLSALCASLSSLKVLLVELGESEQVEQRPGLYDLIQDNELRPEDVVCDAPADMANLSLLLPGTALRVGDLYRPEAVQRVMSSITSSFDLIIVDGGDANSIALSADRIVWVVAAEQTPREVIAARLAEFSQVADRSMGVILNKRRRHIPGWLYSRL